MNRIITTLLLLGLAGCATEAAAQRDLHRQLSLHVQAGTVDGLSDAAGTESTHGGRP